MPPPPRACDAPTDIVMFARIAASLALATLVLAAAGCDRARDSANAAQSDAACGPEDQAILRARLEAELRPRIRDELRAELRAELEADQRRASGQDGTAATHPPSQPRPETNVATAAPTDVPDATQGSKAPDATGGAEPASDDPWSTPGVTIFPSRGGVRLLELAVGTSLEDKLPVNVKKVYEAMPELLYCYSVFENLSSETTITHVWRRGSRLVSRVELEVGSSPRWKTWSKQRTQTQWTGLWSCEVLGPEGQRLGLTVFSLGVP